MSLMPSFLSALVTFLISRMTSVTWVKVDFEAALAVGEGVAKGVGMMASVEVDGMKEGRETQEKNNQKNKNEIYKENISKYFHLINSFSL
jgi:cell shape-determining protein MreC